LSVEDDSHPSVTQTAESQGAAPAVPRLQPIPPKPLKLVPFDEFELEAEHARGGLGRVIRAKDRLGRTVAIKELLQPGVHSERRFEREARLTARLQHPSIVPIHEAGQWPNGLPFYAMKLVAGRTLKAVIGDCKSLDERLALIPNVIAVAEAIAYAHSQRVIHRDLKPSNVLIGDFGETVVVDWGLAKDLDQSGEYQSGESQDLVDTVYRNIAHEELTQAGAVLGTPAYMPPEQAAGAEVDERADVYSLGAMLYHVLTGVPPYLGSTSAEIITAVLANAPPPIATRQEGVPLDLAAIVDKATAREAANRYGSAQEFVSDLRQYQTGQLVSSHHYSPGALLRRWIRRNRLPVTVAALAVAALISFGWISVRRIIYEKDVARDANRVAQLRRADADSARRMSERKTVEMTLANARAELRHDPRRSLSILGTFDATTPKWVEAQAIAADARSLGYSKLVATVNDPIVDMKTSSDGRVVGLATVDRGVFVVDAFADTIEFEDVYATPRSSLSLSKDGRLFAYLSSRSEAVVVDLTTSSKRLLRYPADCLALTPSGDGLMIARHGQALRFVPLTESHSSQVLVGSHVTEFGSWCGINFAADGRTAILTGATGTVMVRLAASTIESEKMTKSTILATAADSEGGQFEVSSDGRYRACRPAGCSSYQKTISTGRDLVTAVPSSDGHQLAIATTSRAGVYGSVSSWDVAVGGSAESVAVSRDGMRLVVGSADGVVRVFEKGTGAIADLHGHEDKVILLACDDGCDRITTASLDGTMRVWDVSRFSLGRLLSIHSDYLTQVVSGPGKEVYFGGGDGQVGRLNTADGLVSVLWEGHQPIVDLQISLDGHWLAAANVDGVIWVRDLWGGSQFFAKGHTGQVKGLAISSKKQLLYSGGDDGLVLVTDLARRSTDEFLRIDAAVNAVAVDATEAFVAVGGKDGTVLVTDTRGTRISGGTSSTYGSVYDLCFIPGTSDVAAAHATGATVLYSGPARPPQLVHRSSVRAVRVAAINGLVATGDANGDVALLTVHSSIPVHILHGHSRAIYGLKFTSGGQLLVSASLDATVRVWDVARQSVTVLRGHQRGISRVAISADGKWMVSASYDRSMRFWLLDSVRPPSWSDSFSFLKEEVPHEIALGDQGRALPSP
jgi:serine/threonine protein kinase/WD40 repeat protein